MAKRKKAKQSDILESAHNIWLAGLGGLAAAEEGGGKLFRALVERGKEFENRLAKPIGKASGSVRGSVEDVRTRAGKALASIETAFDDNVAAVLSRLGVPTRREVAKLTRRVEELRKAVEASGATSRVTRKKRAAKRGAKRKAS